MNRQGTRPLAARCHVCRKGCAAQRVAVARLTDHTDIAMPLKLTEGNLDSPSQGISFEYQDDAETIPCSITPDALRDLGDYHQLDFSEDDLVRVLLREIERL